MLKRIGVAYNESPEARRALASAVQLEVRRSTPLRFSSGEAVHNHTSATMVDKVSCISG